MADIRYTQTAHLSDGHSKGITSVSFNPDGSLLATAGLDGTVCIWNTTTWSTVDIYYSKDAATSLAWYSNSVLVCGLQNGILSSVIKDGEKWTHVNGFWAHLFPVEHLAVRNTLLASGAHRELSIWTWDPQPASSCLLWAIKPPCDNDSDVVEDDEEALVTGVFWTSLSLIATWLRHGIRFYETERWTNYKVIPAPTHPIVQASLSPNGTLLAVSNLVTGFDVYDLNDSKIVRSFTHDIGNQERATPVLFIHGGHAILGGSAVGYVNLWFVDSGIRLEPLHIPNEEKVLAVAAYYDAPADRFLIVTAIMNEESPSSAIIWSATGRDAAGVEEASSLPGAQEHKMSWINFVFTVLGVVVIAAAMGWAFLEQDPTLMMFDEFELGYDFE